MFRLLTGLLALSISVLAQSKGSGKPYAMPLEKPPPQYSREGLLADVSAKVMISLVVDENGAPQSVRVTRAAGFGLDEKAVEAVMHWRFQPGERDGKPVATQNTVEIGFQRRPKRAFGPEASLTFDPLPGTSTRPELISGQSLALDRLPTPPRIRLEFEVGADGKPANIRSPTGAPKELQDAIKSWRFSAQGGRALLSARLELAYQ